MCDHDRCDSRSHLLSRRMLLATGTAAAAGAGLLPDSHPVKASAQAFAAKYEAVHGAGSVSLFAAYTWDVGLLLQQAVPVALKAARPGTKKPSTMRNASPASEAASAPRSQRRPVASSAGFDAA